MEACSGPSPQSQLIARPRCGLIPAKYVSPYRKGQKNDYRDAEAIAEAVQRPTMKFVTTKTAEQLDLLALHRVRERLVSQRTGVINQIRAFMRKFHSIAALCGDGLRPELQALFDRLAINPRLTTEWSKPVQTPLQRQYSQKWCLIKKLPETELASSSAEVG